MTSPATWRWSWPSIYVNPGMGFGRREEDVRASHTEAGIMVALSKNRIRLWKQTSLTLCRNSQSLEDWFRQDVDMRGSGSVAIGSGNGC